MKLFSYFHRLATFSRNSHFDLRKILKKIPVSVVVITTSSSVPPSVQVRSDPSHRVGGSEVIHRGMTCSTFTGVSLNPPIVSFCIAYPSHMLKFLKQSNKFAVNVLAHDQINLALHFSQRVGSTIEAEGHEDQFLDVPYEYHKKCKIPILKSTSASLLCTKASIESTVGDHAVVYGKVEDAHVNNNVQSLLYYASSFHALGDELFMKAFEETSLPFSYWTHKAHVRMAFNYLKNADLEKAIPLIKNGIQRYNERNKHLISRGYNETITMFYIHFIHHLIQSSDNNFSTFHQFLDKFPNVMQSDLPFQYFSQELLSSEEAKTKFLKPDLKDLPTLI